MKLFHKAIVAIRDPGYDVELFRYARVLPELSPGIECCFVHIRVWPDKPHEREPYATHKQVLEALQQAVETHYGLDASCRVLNGDVVDRLLESVAEQGADLVLLGHGPDHSGRSSLARRLAMKAPCSVWMRPQGSAMEVRRILGAVDYSETSAYALSMAALMASRLENAECHALHVYFNEAVTGSDEYGAATRAGEQAAFERFVAPLDTGGLEIRPIFLEGPNVAHAVALVAEGSGADLVVMGSRGQSRSASVLLGSESDHMLMTAKVPVLIAKRRGERIGLLRALLDREFHLEEPPRFG